MKPLRVDEAFDGYHEDDRDPNAGWWSRPAVAHPLAATWGLDKPFPGRDVAHVMIKPSVVLRVWVA